MIRYFIFKQNEANCNECFFIDWNDHQTIYELTDVKYAWTKDYYETDYEKNISLGHITAMEGSILYSGLLLLREHLKKQTNINNTIDKLLK